MFRRWIVAVAGAACLMLVSCGGGDDSLATRSDIAIGAPSTGATPFIARFGLKGASLARVTEIRYVIAPKAGAVAEAVDVTYTAAALARSGDLVATAGTASLPVFGLYAGRDNAVTVILTFADGSRQSLSTRVVAPTFTDTNAGLDRPTIRKSLAAPNPLGYSYFYLKSGISGPVVVDVDGEVRWVVPEPMNAYSSAFIDNGFIVGAQDSTQFQRIELDGRVSRGTVDVPRYTSFHHNIEPGKTGWLAEFNAIDADGVPQIESIVTEMDATGRVIKEWNFADILADHMRSQGDDPAAFIRPGIDWFHVNAATYDPRDDSVMASSRENFVVKVDYQTGRLIWIFGDPTKYWYSFPSLQSKALRLQDGGLHPLGQHAISITRDGLLMLFNNGAPSFNQPAGAPVGESRSYSAVSAYRIDATAMTAAEQWRFDYGQSIRSDICSSAYETPTGTMLLNYAAADARTRMRVVGLDAARQVAFDFEYVSLLPCISSWNAVTLRLNGLRIE